MITMKSYIPDCISGICTTENVALKAQSGQIYYKSGEVVKQNHNSHNGAIGMIKKATFTTVDFPVGTVIVSFGFYASRNGKMYEESSFYSGNIIFDGQPLDIYAEIWLGLNIDGSVPCENNKELFDFFFLGATSVFTLSTYRFDVARVVLPLTYDPTIGGMRYNCGEVWMLDDAYVCINGKKQFQVCARLIGNTRVQMGVNVMEIDRKMPPCRIEGVYCGNDLLTKSEYTLAEYCTDIEPRLTYRNYLEDILEADEVQYFDHELFCQKAGGNTVWLRTPGNNLSRYQTCIFLEKDIESISFHSKMFFVITKNRKVTAYATDPGGTTLQKIKNNAGSVFDGATSIHTSAGFAAITVCYQEKNKCTVKEYSFIRNSLMNTVTYTHLTTKIYIQPRVISSMSSDTKLIIDYKSGEVSLVGVSGMGLTVASIVKELLLKNKEVSIHGSYVYINGQEPALYRISSGEKVPMQFACDEYITLLTNRSNYYARVYCDNSFELFVYDEFSKQFENISERITLLSRPVKFVITHRDAFVQTENRERYAYTFAKHRFRLRLKGVMGLPILAYSAMYVFNETAFQWRLNDVAQIPN